MEIIPAKRMPDTAVEQCLAELRQRDIFLARDFSSYQLENAWAAIGDDEITGLAWTHIQRDGAVIDVRVLPRYRRKGVGAALFETLTESLARPWYANCDGAQDAAIQFLSKRQFDMDGAVHAQRWDGVLADVPPAFKNAIIQQTNDHALVSSILSRAYETHWLKPNLVTLRAPSTSMYLAMNHKEALGALVTHHLPKALVVCGLGVLSHTRQRGIGRALLCSAMEMAAQRGIAVASHVCADDEQTIAWTRSLGFWSYRTKLQFSRHD